MTGGKHRIRRKRWPVVFVAIVIGLLLVPTVTLPFAPVDPDAERQQPAEAPRLINTDGHPNTGFLADAGAWFDDHFGFRQALITADARLSADVFQTSPTDQVIVGRDGYLYYGATLSDFARTNVMTDREADNAAFNLALLESATRDAGAQFLLAVAPNKNSLYPQFMPYFDLAGEGASSWEVLKAKLDEYGVTYLDLFDLFKRQSDILYMKTDTHWSTRGALLAYNAMMEALGRPHLSYEDSPIGVDEGFVGDLEAMLYPVGATPEPQEVVEEATNFSYVNDADAVEDSSIETASSAPDRAGSLVMYRDSFGNALLPLFATDFKQAYFTKLVPYYFQEIVDHRADTVIVERAERHLAFFATTPPLMAAPVKRGLSVEGEASGATTMDWSLNGPFAQVSGLIDEGQFDDPAHIYVVVRDGKGWERWFEAFHQTVVEETVADAGASGAVTLDEAEEAESAAERPASHDNGYFASIPRQAIPAEGEALVVVESAGGAIAVSRQAFDLNNPS